MKKMDFAINFFIFFMAVYFSVLSISVVNLFQYDFNQYEYYQEVAIFFNFDKRVELIKYIVVSFIFGLYLIFVLIEKEFNFFKLRYKLIRSFVGIYKLDLVKVFSFLFFSLLMAFIFFMPFLFNYVKSFLFIVGLFFLWLVFLSRLDQRFLVNSFSASFSTAFLKGTSKNLQGLGARGKGCIITACNPLINSFHQRTNKLGTAKIPRSGVFSGALKISFSFIVFFSVFQFVYLLADQIYGPPKFIAEYLNVSEKTFFHNEYVDNDILRHKYNIFSGNINYIPEGEDAKADLFYLRDKYELHRQIHSRFMIHHHSFMLNPINDFSLGRDPSAVMSQYGIGFPYLIEKFLSFSDILRLDSWMKVFYISNYVYLLFFGLFVFLITKSYFLTGFAVVTFVTIANIRGFELLVLPPGDAPWRNFFDVFVLYFLYLFSTSKRIVFFALSILLSLFSIFINPQIGIMIFISTVVVGFFSVIVSEKRNKIILAVFLFLISFFAFYLYQFFSSYNDLAGYYMDGLLGSKISDKSIVFVFFVLAAMYVAVLYLYFQKRAEDRLQVVYLLWIVLYSNLLLFYAFWNFSFNGLSVRSYIYFLAFFLVLNAFGFFARKFVFLFSFFLLFLLYFYSSIYVIKDKILFYDNFETHKVYLWSMDRAIIKSTLDPTPFVDSIQLIKKYSSGNGFYIISEYDNLLPFLSGKYSYMPFFDMKWYLITKKEIDKSIDVLINKNPEYIFIDSNFSRNLCDEVISEENSTLSYLHEESYWRAQRLKKMYSIFDHVSDKYELLESKGLLSVYKRKKS